MLNTAEEFKQENLQYEWQQKVMYCNKEEENQVQGKFFKTFKKLKFFFYMIIQEVTKDIMC